MSEPLIYTSKGNVPIASLKYEVQWVDCPEYVKFIERYRDETGEIVKESAHVYDRKGLSIDALAGTFG